MGTGQQDALYLKAAGEFGPALERLARVYEADPDQRRDLLQDIHLALWRSFAGFNGQCSLRTWVYRVAHNTGISGRIRKRRARLVNLDEVAETPAPGDAEVEAGQAQALARLAALIRSLKPPDDQVMLLYLEDLDAAAIGEITGLSARAVATRIHRIKKILAVRFGEGGDA
jgi:RNA polymerase sigma-70 factor (ECF subfamily)